MGVITDIRDITGKKTINPSAVDGIPAHVADYLKRLENITGDPAYPAAFNTKNEAQSIAQFVPTVSGGTFTLTVTLANGETFTTAAIAFGASAATIESAIDTAATGVVTGWTNGDISVAGGDLNTAPVTLTFDGTSVAGTNHSLTTADGSALTGGGSMGAITETTPGQTKRTSWAVLDIIQALTGNPPTQGEISPIVGSDGRHKFAAFPDNLVLRHLCQEADAEDDSPDGLLDALLVAVGLDNKNSSSV